MDPRAGDGAAERGGRAATLTGRGAGGPARRPAPACYDADVNEAGDAVFRRFHEAWTRGDLATVMSLVEPDVVVRPLHGAMFTRSEFRGHDGIAEWHREMTEPWDRFEAVVEDVRELPPGTVLGVVRLVGYRGDEGLHLRVGSVAELRNGRIATLTARNVADVEKEIAESAGGADLVSED